MSHFEYCTARIEGTCSCGPATSTPYPNLGPVFTATYACPCSYCDEEIQDGDQIRADGFGNWIHADCASFANGE